MTSKNVSIFLNSPQKFVHIQFCDFGNNTGITVIHLLHYYDFVDFLELKKLLLVSSNGILTVMHCVENIPTSFIYLAVTKIVTTFIVDQTVILSDGVNLFLITLDKQYSKIVKQVVTQLKGITLILNNYI